MITGQMGRLHDIRINYTYPRQEWAAAEAYIAARADREHWTILFVPTCQCCGAWWGISGSVPHFRCQKHVGRNPCAIEGCKCTTADRGHPSSDDYLCGKHFRPLVTPRERRTLNMVRRKYRTAIRRGDGEEQLRTTVLYWKVLRRMVKLARRRSAGDIDMTEINKMFGWE